MNRTERLRTILEEPLLVSDGVNVRYLTGFDSSNAALLVETDRVRLFSDFRYAEAARGVEGVEFVETKRSLFASLAELLEGRVGFEADDVAYGSWETLNADGLELVPRRGLVEALRAVKDQGEIDAIRRAGAITSEAYARFADEPFIGRSERELAWRLEELFHELGADAPAFEAIVASGENSARPHARPTDREVGAGETVVIDAGVIVDGYCSDCTRTLATGSLDDSALEIYELVLRAQTEALAATRAGAQNRAVDAVAREIIDAAGHAEHFGHGLGHGVGLEVHEAPRLGKTADGALEAGNAVTVEPGVYLPGDVGVRIEDLVIVTDGEPEILTGFPKELVTVG
jgi:Xaa-Pro aminopeptidase